MRVIGVVIVCERDEFIARRVGKLRKGGPDIAGDVPGARFGVCPSRDAHHGSEQWVCNLRSRKATTSGASAKKPWPSPSVTARIMLSPQGWRVPVKNTWKMPISSARISPSAAIMGISGSTSKSFPVRSGSMNSRDRPKSTMAVASPLCCHRSARELPRLRKIASGK